MKEQSRAEALSAEVLQLSVQLQQAIQAYNGLARMYASSPNPFFPLLSNCILRASEYYIHFSLYSYKPVLRNIETNLLKIKQDGSETMLRA